MFVRSQDKKSIVNLNNILEIYSVVFKSKGVIKEYYETEIRCQSGSEETIGILGKYSSEEKAIKVLDMIQEAYLEPTYISCYSDLEYAKHEYKVFQMPLDDDVIIDD